MIKSLKRIGVILFQRFFNVDDLSFKFPIAVKGVLIENDRVLLLRNEMFIFDLPGGKLEKDQDFEAALIEEFKEETNLDIKVKSLLELKKYFINNRDIVVATYEVENISNNPITISYENWGYDFVKLSELEINEVKPWIKGLLKENFIA